MKNIILLSALALTISMTTSCKKAAGDKAEVTEAAPAPVAQPRANLLPVDINGSIINWEGAKPTGKHNGTIRLSGGQVYMDGGTISGGSFTLDMNSITNLDLSGDSKTNLENHLKGFADGKEDHFFNVAKYPTGTFEITKVTKISGDESSTHLIYGNLTLKGITKQVGFRALVGVGSNRVEVTVPPFTIDRTLWGVNYNSKTVFEGLGNKYVNDEIGLSMTLKAGTSVI